MSGGVSRCVMPFRRIVLPDDSNRWRRYRHDAMTYNTPGETDTERWWCNHCRLAVEPVGDDEPTCPACGRALDG